MDLVGIAEIISAIAVLVGLGFAVSEVKRSRERKLRESALALVSSYQTPEFAKAVMLVTDLPEGLSRRQLEEQLAGNIYLIALLMTTWESLGILTFRHEVSMQLVDDFFSGPIVVSWRKLQPLAQEMRDREGRQTYFEWFQWLAERMMERESESPPVPAHVGYREWRER